MDHSKPRRKCFDAGEPGQPPFKRLSGGENGWGRPWSGTGQEDGANEQEPAELTGRQMHRRWRWGRDPIRRWQGAGRDEATGLAAMAFRAALAIGIVVTGEAEIGKSAIGKDVGGHSRCDRHGRSGLLDKGRRDENQRAEHARRQIRQPISQKTSRQLCPRKPRATAKVRRRERQAGNEPHARIKTFHA